MTPPSVARERILSRLRAAPQIVMTAPAVLTSPAEQSPETMLEQFRRGIEAFHAEVIDARERTWPIVLAEICATKRIATLMLPPVGMVNLQPWLDGPRLSRFDRPIETLKTELFDATNASLTIADGAIADTGTLIQSDPQRMPRTLSLVPPIHICLLDVRHLYPSLQSAVAATRWAEAMPSNLIFITGPSKTADIQQTMAYGAHGPRELVVLLTEDL
ncbi:MAG: lactate utilization protein C [Sulfuritalea sp.]|nr:lactate utilization protein C [Sulfuritalea sp.]